ncbi:MAG: CapA family protein [Bacillota bacterium]
MCKAARGMSFILFAAILGMNASCKPVCARETVSRKPLSLILLGDVMLDRRIRKWSGKVGGEYPFHPDTVCILKTADAVFANLESPIGMGGRPLEKKELWFCASPDMAPKLRGSGINVVSLANNHILDYGVSVFQQTMRILEGNGIRHVGGGRNAAEAGAPLILAFREKKIAFFAYSELAEIYWDPANPRSFLATDVRPGILPIKAKEIVRAIRKIRKHADLIVVSLHWGTEYRHYPALWQRKTAHQLIDAGADIIAGHHPHVLQGVEYYHRGLIFYSLGNFVFDQAKTACRETMIVRITFAGKPRIQIFPMLIRTGQPVPAEGNAALSIMEKIRKYSRPLGDLEWLETE